MILSCLNRNDINHIKKKCENHCKKQIPRGKDNFANE